TASLSAHEVDQLFKLTRRLKEKGVSILFISHRMEEVFTISDRVTVLRDGRFVSSHPAAQVTPESAISDMVGRHMDDFFAKTASERGDLLLSVNNLSKENVFHDINFDVHAGEVVGFAGLVGSRRTDVALALFGIETADSGTITFDGQTANITSPQQAVKLGIAYVTEDRRQLGLTMPMSITTNISLPMLRRYTNRYGLVQRREEKETAESFRERLNIRAASLEQTAGTLSGGNQQKVVLSKWLNTQPRLLILDEPTRGIDVGAKAEVHHIIDQLAQQGMGIIMISSDLPEVLAMSDRIVVMREGRQMAILDRSEATQERVMTAAMGQTA
ncbi:MAG: sugar ABC transporter ATP-binding protein, partial [Anaerolineales bacterium]|nr:sugar ABC transporter ATP-binding protein [Anaerolineales bacterium]